MIVSRMCELVVSVGGQLDILKKDSDEIEIEVCKDLEDEVRIWQMGNILYVLDKKNSMSNKNVQIKIRMPKCVNILHS